MLVMAVLLLAGTTFMTISSTESQIARNEQASAQAVLLAEAAIHKAIAQLDADSSYPGEVNTLLGRGSFTVAVTTAPTAEQKCPAGTAKNLVATASVPVGGGTAQVQIRATADQIAYPFRWAAYAAVPNQIVVSPNQLLFGADRTESELWLMNQSTTDGFDSTLGAYDGTSNSGMGGSIGGNADITLGTNAAIKGSVRAGDALHAGAGVIITGGQTVSLSPNQSSPGESFPSLTPPTTPTTSLDAPSATFTLTAGDLNVTHGTLPLPFEHSPYHFTSMTFASDTSLTTSGDPVTVYVTGAVTVGDNVIFGAHPGTNLHLIMKSNGASWLDTADFTAGMNFHFYGSLYGKNTNIQLQDGAQVYGSIIGRTVVLHENSATHFDQAMLNQEMCHNGKYAIRRGTWFEVIP